MIPNSYYASLQDALANLVETPLVEYEFSNGTRIPTMATLKPGQTEAKSIALTGVGSAILLAPGASDIPIVRVGLTKDKYPVVLAAAAYDVEFQEQRASEYFGMDDDLDEAKIDFTRSAIEERLNRFAAYGEPAIGAFGLYNNPMVTIVNSAFNPNTADFAGWVSFLVSAITASKIKTGQVEVLLPENFYSLSQTITAPNNPETSALQAVEKRFAGRTITFSTVEQGNAAMLEANGVLPAGTDRDRTVVYQLDKTVLSRQIESTVAEFAVGWEQTRGLTKFIPMFACASATKIHQPRKVRYINTVKATV